MSKKIIVEVEGDDAEMLVEYLASIERLLTEIRDALAKKPAPRTRRKADG